MHMLNFRMALLLGLFVCLLPTMANAQNIQSAPITPSVPTITHTYSYTIPTGYSNQYGYSYATYSNSYGYTLSRACVTTYSSASGYSTTCSGASINAANSSIIVAPLVMRAAVTQTVDMISDRLERFAARSGGAQTSKHGNSQTIQLAASGQTSDTSAERKPEFWTSVAIQHLSQDHIDMDFDGSVNTVMMGVDYVFTPKFMAGLALGYEWSDLDTTFNLGNYESSGITLAPYGVYKFNNQLSIDGTFGVTRLSIEMDRLNGAITSDTDALRTFAASHLNYNTQFDKLRLGLRAGYLFAREEYDAFTESNGSFTADHDATLGQYRLGARLGYAMETLEPYISLRYESDELDTSLSNFDYDDDGFTLSSGMHIYNHPRFSGHIGVGTNIGRDQFVTQSVRAQIVYKLGVAEE